MLGAVSHRESSIQVLVHGNQAASQSGAPAHRFNLQPQVLNANRIVAVDGTLELQRENQIQISVGAAHKGTASFPSRDLEVTVELGQVVLTQEVIGCLRAADSAQA